MKNINIDNVDAKIVVQGGPGVGPGGDGGDPVEPIAGCTDPAACNYNSYATYNSGSCTYPDEYCMNLSGGEDYLGGFVDAGADCEMAPLNVCPGCYITDSDWGIPQYTNNDGGTNNEWCEYCNDPDALNYVGPWAVTDLMIAKPSMCRFGVCLTPQNSALTACNVHEFSSQVPGFMVDNYEHDEDKCVYAHTGCHCVPDGQQGPGVTAWIDSDYCGNCMDGQPYPPAVSYQEGLSEEYCDCEGNVFSEYCNCSGTQPAANCDCEGNLISSAYCDCAAEQPTSSICGCDGGATGTTLPAYPTISTFDTVGNTISVYDNIPGGQVACDCDGSETPTAYYLDVDGDGYGWSGDGAIYVCTAQLEGGSLNISTPGAPAAGGWSTSQSACADADKDCNGTCPSEYISSYGANVPAQLNSCTECISPSGQIGNWDTECCFNNVFQYGPSGEGSCQVCNDAYWGVGAYSDGVVSGAMSVDSTSNTDSSSINTQRVLYQTNVPNTDSSSQDWLTDHFFTCNCANLVGANYYTDDIENTMYIGDACASCLQKNSDDFKTIVTDVQVSAQLGANGIVQNGAGQYFCDCNASTPVVPGGGCCAGKVLACNGQCYYPGSEAAPVDVGCGCGEPEPDECGVCAGGGIPGGNCDCNGNILDCAGDCGGSAVEDECGVCNGNNSSCTGCMDPDAENYDSDATIECDTCCTYLTANLLQLIQADTDADATGEVVSQDNLVTPFTMLQSVFSEYYTDVISSLQVWYHHGTIDSNLSPNSLTGQAIYGWKEFIDNDFITGQAGSANYITQGNNLYQWKPPTISSRVQKVSADNLKIICENPQTNGVVSYNIYDSNNVLSLADIYYYGDEAGFAMSNPYIDQYYSTLYTNSLDGYADVSKIRYYFYFDETIDLNTSSVEQIFGGFSGVEFVKYVTDVSGQSPSYMLFDDGQVWDSIGNIQSGVLGYLASNGLHPTPTIGNTTYINSQGAQVTGSVESIPVYHVYEITVRDAEEFIIDLTEIPFLLAPADIEGCMNMTACNYNPNATIGNESMCNFPVPGYYCDGSSIPVEGCMDVAAENYNPSANVDTENVCIYSGCTDPLALNYNVVATVDDDSCVLPAICDGLPLTPICCESGFTNSTTNFTLLDNIPISNEECEICDSSICANENNTVYICCAEDAINTYAGDFIEGVTICSSTVCDFESPEPSTLHIKTAIAKPYEVTPAMLETLQWVIYDTSANIVASSSFISSEAAAAHWLSPMYGVSQVSEIRNIDNIDTNSGCLWFIPIGYKENPIWDYVQLEVMYGNNPIHKLYGKHSIPIRLGTYEILGGPSIYPTGENYSSSTEKGSVKITQYGECELDCDKNTVALQTEFCEFPLRKDVIEFTEVFLIVETSQQDGDFSQSSVVIYNLDTGDIITEVVGLSSNSTYSKRFVILKDTSIGIKAVGNGTTPLSYKLISEFGKVITTKVIL
jgi:hypothetical protein